MSFAKYYDLLMADIDYTELIDFLKEYIKPDDLVIDAGCGVGNIMLLLLDEGYHIIGIDNDQDMLDVIKEKRENVSDLLINHDLEKNINIKANIVISLFDVVNYFQNPTKMLANIHQTLKPNGLLIFDFYKEEYLSEINGYIEDEEEPIPYLFTSLVENNTLISTISIDNQTFIQKEYVLPLNHYIRILTEIGFKNIEVKEVFDERKHYIIARK